MSKHLGFILIALIALLVVLSASMFTVDQRQNALVFQLGEVVSVKTKPGLYFKLPLVQNVRYFCLLYTSPSPRDKRQSRMPSSA